MPEDDDDLEEVIAPFVEGEIRGEAMKNLNGTSLDRNLPCIDEDDHSSLEYYRDFRRDIFRAQGIVDPSANRSPPNSASTKGNEQRAEGACATCLHEYFRLLVSKPRPLLRIV